MRSLNQDPSKSNRFFEVVCTDAGRNRIKVSVDVTLHKKALLLIGRLVLVGLSLVFVALRMPWVVELIQVMLEMK